MELVHSTFQLGGQLASAQMDVAQRRLDRAVTGELRELMHIPLGAR